MTNPHWITKSIRNNFSHVGLANFTAFIYCSSYSEPNIDHKILPCLPILFMEIYKQTFSSGYTGLENEQHVT